MPDNATDRPLVTFALFAYNQEKYIREAVEGAFAQTYEPLEIILSDDCSNDQTFEIMQKMAAAYEGPHEVKVRQSGKNRGIIAHINDVSNDVLGEIVFVAAGDDISLPNRVDTIVPIYACRKDIFATFSDFSIIGRGSQERKISQTPETCSLYEIALNGGGLGKGATYAYRKACFDWPGKLNPELFSEDRLLPLRAAMLGNVAYIPNITVLYREEERGMGRVLKHSGRLSFNLKSHVNTITSEMRIAQQSGCISYFAFLKCSMAIRIRYLSTQGNMKKGQYRGVAYRVTHRLTLRLLRSIMPARKRMCIDTGEP